jgi:hypothetical protein
MKVKVCVRCNEYVSIHESNYLANKRLTLFEQSHSSHPLVIVDSSEIGQYKNVNEKYDELIR